MWKQPVVLMTNERPKTSVVKGDEVKLYFTLYSTSLSAAKDKCEKSREMHSHRAQDIF